MLPFVLTLAVVVAAATPSQEALLAEAESAFAAGHARLTRGESGRAEFLRAAAVLERLEQQGVSNEILQRNRGTSYLLAGDLPRAILHYRLGRRARPDDAALAACLAAARAQVVHADAAPREPPDAGHRWLDPRTTSGGAAGLYILGWALLTGWLIRGRTAMLLGGVAALLASGALAALLVVVGPPGSWPPLVVIAGDRVALRMGDGESYPPWSEVRLNRGHEALLRHRRGDWLQIELPDGAVGWVHRRDAAVSEQNNDP